MQVQQTRRKYSELTRYLNEYKIIITNNELDYYLIRRDNNFAIPFLVGDYDIDPKCMKFLTKGRVKEDNTPVYLIFAPPYARKPSMVDYLYLERREVYSRKIYDVLKDKGIKGLQLVPAIVKDNKGEEYIDYWIANIHQRYSFFDSEKTGRSRPDSWGLITKIALDEKKVLEIPLEDRLVFVSAENTAYVLYHKSIVDLIMSVNPQGPVFVSLEDWRG